MTREQVLGILGMVLSACLVLGGLWAGCVLLIALAASE
jgi:hypothetical protein